MIEKNQEFVGIVERLGANGEGVIKNDGIVVFIPYVLPEEKIRYKILKVAKTYAYGKVLEILVPAEDRVRPLCPVFGRCGGCQLQHFNYVNELKFKTTLVSDCFKKIANLNIDVKPTLKNNNEYGYRNKLQLPIGAKNGESFIGFYAENSHRIVPISKCCINPDWSEKLILAIKQFMINYRIQGYDEETKRGILRHVVAREADTGIIITLVSAKKQIPHIDAFVEILKEYFIEFSLFVNFNDKDTNVVLGDEFTLIYGKDFYTTEMCGIKVDVGVRSFMQVNYDVASKIYQNALKLLDIEEDTFVIDAYSGAGLMTAMFAKKARHAYGIEIIEEAVNIANKLALKNCLEDKMTNICGDCAEVLPPLVSELSAQGKVAVVLDPPRKGCDKKVIDAILKCNIDKIVYISCNPATLARDVGLLVGSLYYDGKEVKRAENYEPKYEVSYARPYDMFSKTKHVETLICLTRK